ncbi:MAG: galactokinase [Dehalococcoidia bacterium]|nr:galactokinase [Dehalococcoidia bacterium]
MTADREALRRSFARDFGREPEVIAEAPARVNLIGEHTDYNGGFVLPVAIDRTIAVAAALRDDDLFRVRALDFGECDEFRWDTVRRAQGWRNYPRGVAWALAEAGHHLRGADLAVTGDVPPGAGLSSSAALAVAAGGAVCALSGIDVPPRELALLCQRAENAFAGVQCGIMDQFASALGVAGHALLIDCRSLDVEPVAFFGPDVAIAVVDSRAPRRLADTAYNQRRQECSEAARLLGVASLRDAGLEQLEANRERLPEPLGRRARHVISENRRVLDAVAALRRGDTATFGGLMYRSHESLRDDFEVSTPELDLLVELARATDGVLGSRLTGAGFGGCTVSLVRQTQLGEFRARILGEYGRQTGLEGEMHVCSIAGGLKV